MKQRLFLFATILVLFAIVFSVQLIGQSQNKGIRVGIGGGFLMGSTEKDDDDIGFSGWIFIRHNIMNKLDGDLTGTMGQIKATDYQADLYLAEYKVLYKPYVFGKWEPYVGGGIGIANYYSHWRFRSNNYPKDGYVGYIPVALGVEYAITDKLQADVNASYSYSFSDAIVTNKQTGKKGPGLNDAWFGIFAGISYTIFGSDDDADRDGLLKSEEKQLGTNPDKVDTDGDGLNDGDEVNKYHTNPLKVDSDGDGLSDKDEVVINKTNPNKADSDGDGLSDGDEVSKYKTDPLKTDSDGDGLSDGDEVSKYKTDPLKVDTDADGLNDSDEVLKYKTDPLKADNDGDGLIDGDEVLKYKTDPMKVDTDGDGISDANEVKNRTNPLDANDPKKPEPKKPEAPEPVALKAEVGKAIILEGVVFKSGSAVIEAASNAILGSAKKTFEENPEIEVQIQGFTDNVGNVKTNEKLSQKRADAVKAWLVKNGIDAKRITAKGFGDKNPIGDNSTPEGRAKNRRIEFFRTK
jgi:outer membrane protein OmpA-like peptidoglycan-associated protein